MDTTTCHTHYLGNIHNLYISILKYHFCNHIEYISYHLECHHCVSLKYHLDNITGWHTSLVKISLKYHSCYHTKYLSDPIGITKISPGRFSLHQHCWHQIFCYHLECQLGTTKMSPMYHQKCHPDRENITWNI